MSVLSMAENDGFCSCDKNGGVTAISLPVAQQLVARTRFSQPPPSAKNCLTVPDALLFLEEAVKRGVLVSKVMILGPGDPLATPEPLFYALSKIQSLLPNTPVYLRSLGINSSKLASELAEHGVKHVEMIVEGVRAPILEKIYSWIRPGAKTLKLQDASKLLIEEQRIGVSALKFHNIDVSIYTTLYPHYNIDHVHVISGEMVEHGADSIALIPYQAHPDAEVALDEPTTESVQQAREKAAKHLPLSEPLSADLIAERLGSTAEDRLIAKIKAAKTSPNIALISSNDINVDLHLGQASKFLIYSPQEDGRYHFLETRDAPKPGTKDRWLQVVSLLKDCSVLLIANGGEKPLKIFREHGLQIFLTNKNINNLLELLCKKYTPH